MTRVALNDTVLNIQIDHCHDTAPWLVCSNSLVTDLTIWDGMIGSVSGWNVLRYDQRGHGGSDLPQGALGWDLLVQDLLAVMDHAQIPRAVCVGLSMGVPTALGAYDIAPKRFSGLVLLNGMAKSAPNAATAWGERIALARAHGMAHYGDITATRWLTDDRHHHRLRDMIAATPLEGFGACATALMRYDYTDVLSKITCPSLLMAGLCDGGLPDTMRAMAKRVGADFHGIDQAGHVPCFEQVAPVSAALNQFLAPLKKGTL
ncbi:hypothetical protein BFP70_18845 [Thioclava sp. SK-1]|uniref:alpha/beta fold hydrolase n=1 Tax=Thioclava sp. SK-1 TaxID=1889770 RepID=UPI00082463C4|nr:alpha/beta fold hydrolase [Thioclava sp. SK-1]OCX58123.1 hypothetical protein BFP70_18845 [Thioclava sp. SK-1]